MSWPPDDNFIKMTANRPGKPTMTFGAYDPSLLVFVFYCRSLDTLCWCDELSMFMEIMFNPDFDYLGPL